MSEKVEFLRVETIDPSPYLLRLDQHTDMQELTESLAIHGQIYPVNVRAHPSLKDRYQLIFGHRRLEAGKRLSWTHICAKLVCASDEEMLTVALVENLQRENLTDYEKGLALKTMNEKFGKSYEAIAAVIGKSKSYVAQHIAMTRLFDERTDPEVQKVLQVLTEGHARVILRIRDPKKRQAIAQLVTENRLCVKETEKIIGLFGDVAAKGHADRTRATVTNREQVKHNVLRLFEAINRGDFRGVVSAHLNNFTTVQNLRPYSIISGFEAIRQIAEYIKMHDSFNMACNDVEVKVLANVAYAICSVTKAASMKGERYQQHSLVTFILIKKDRDWFIVHEHWSIPQPSYPELVSSVISSKVESLLHQLIKR